MISLWDLSHRRKRVPRSLSSQAGHDGFRCLNCEFLQSTGNIRRKFKMTTIVSGIVNEDGSIQSGSGFTTVHENTGLYQIIFNQKFPSSPAVTTSQDWNNVYPGGGDTRDGAVPV